MEHSMRERIVEEILKETNLLGDDSNIFADRILAIVREENEALRNALGAVQMLIEEDIEENRGFTFNRKKMLEKIEEVLK